MSLSSRSITNSRAQRHAIAASASVRRGISAEAYRRRTGHRADNRLVAHEELYGALEAQIAQHRRSRPDNDARNVANQLKQITGRLFHQDAAFHVGRAVDAHAAVDGLYSASHMCGTQGNFAV